MRKIMILTDSAANPRSFPEIDKTLLEDTYPYQLRKKLDDCTFWQLSFGDITTDSLCSQAIGYLHHWKPELIIVHSGMNDSRPELLPTSIRIIFYILKRIRRIRGIVNLELFLNKSLYVNKSKKSRVTKESFKRTLKRFKYTFSESTIYWMEICADDGYEEYRPGYNEKAKEYNKIIQDVFGNNMLQIRDLIKDVNGFNSDTLHWNRRAHDVIAEYLIKRILSEIEDG